MYHNDENKEACYNDLYNESKKRGGDLVKITTVMDNKAGEQKSLTANMACHFLLKPENQRFCLILEPEKQHMIMPAN